jgi:ribosomal protein L35AE/L33A
MTDHCTDATHSPAEPSKGPCPTCDRPRCNGTTSAGGRCRKQPVKGATVCRTHGGSAPQVRAAAEQRLLERQALVAAEAFGLPREVDPHTALLEELHRAAGAVQWLGALVADLERESIVWGKVKETHGTQLEKGTDNGTTKAAAVNVWVRLWTEERDRLAKVAKTCVDVGIEERRVRLAESAGQQLAAVIRSVLDQLELSDEQRVLALRVVPDELRRLAGDVVPGQVVGGGAA